MYRTGDFHRNRYWGTPLNIWECECGHMESVGSKKELHELSDDCPEEIELHRPFIDKVTIQLSEVRKADAPGTGSNRLLVRFRFHAVCAVSLSV